MLRAKLPLSGRLLDELGLSTSYLDSFAMIIFSNKFEYNKILLYSLQNSGKWRPRVLPQPIAPVPLATTGRHHSAVIFPSEAFIFLFS